MGCLGVGLGRFPVFPTRVFLQIFKFCVNAESKSASGLGKLAMQEGRTEEGVALLRHALAAAHLYALNPQPSTTLNPLSPKP